MALCSGRVEEARCLPRGVDDLVIQATDKRLRDGSDGDGSVPGVPHRMPRGEAEGSGYYAGFAG